MSLTSYRAAPPRDSGIGFFSRLSVFLAVSGFCFPDFFSGYLVIVMRDTPVYFPVVFLSRSGGDLLSHVLRRSTIGATALNGRVRDGIGCFARAMATRPGKKHDRRAAFVLRVVQVVFGQRS